MYARDVDKVKFALIREILRASRIQGLFCVCERLFISVNKSVFIWSYQRGTILQLMSAHVGAKRNLSPYRHVTIERALKIIFEFITWKLINLFVFVVTWRYLLEYVAIYRVLMSRMGKLYQIFWENSKFSSHIAMNKFVTKYFCCDFSPAPNRNIFQHLTNCFKLTQFVQLK
jgi:hypothetical protein